MPTTTKPSKRTARTKPVAQTTTATPPAPPVTIASPPMAIDPGGRSTIFLSLHRPASVKIAYRPNERVSVEHGVAIDVFEVRGSSRHHVKVTNRIIRSPGSDLIASLDLGLTSGTFQFEIENLDTAFSVVAWSSMVAK